MKPFYFHLKSYFCRNSLFVSPVLFSIFVDTVLQLPANVCLKAAAKFAISNASGTIKKIKSW